MDQNRKFLFQLALELNYKSVSELENTMSSSELQEWIEYYTEEPFSSRVQEVQLATLTEIVLKSINSKTDLTALDFMITVSDEQKQKQKDKIKQAEMLEKLKAFGT